MELKTIPDKLINSPAIAESQMDEEYIGHLAAIVESSEDAIISKSLDGTIRSWNKGSEKMLGYTAKEVIGKHISLIIPPEYIDQEKNILKRICNNETIDHYETVRIKKSGEQFYVSLTVSPLKDRAGNIIGVSKIARDITASKKSEAELINANKELLFQNKEKENRATELVIANKELAFQNEEKEKRAAELIATNKDLTTAEEQLKDSNNELESFSYSVSHDLRAPLRAISGYSKMLKRNFENQLDPEANRLMNNIANNATKMGQLIDDLLAFSRISRKELVKMNIQMQAMVTNLCTDLKNEQSNRNIEFHINQLFPARADNIAIKQVWFNLISNAIKYSRLKDTAIIEIGSQLNGNEITYYIKDNGAGFDMRYADKLFGVFQRLHSDEEFEGTGVGLALVQRIITKHGGRVWGEAKVNEGATFYFTLIKS
jgi:PAS domain S-box-containing protein